MNRKICVITGSRAEYGLLYWLMKEIDRDKSLELQVVVTGMHLSPEFGNTYRQIEEDKFIIDKKVDMLLSSDGEASISKSIGLGMITFSDVFNDLHPDLILVLGDRFEIFSAVSAAMIAKIPIAHIHGGEVTEGVIDEAIRHSITKMSHLHFVANKKYSDRVIQLGEQPNRVFNVGGLGIDSINNLNLLSRSEVEKALGFEFRERNLLVTFHPLTLENKTEEKQFSELLSVLGELKSTLIIFTKANADTNGRIINTMIDQFVAKHSNASSYKSMGQLNYISSLQFVDAVVGNSSSGLLEAPSFKVGTINIGERQRGRIKANSVIDCKPNKESIKKALTLLYSKEFQDILKNVLNPYGNGGATKAIHKIIRDVNLDGIITKPFYDITHIESS